MSKNVFLIFFFGAPILCIVGLVFLGIFIWSLRPIKCDDCGKKTDNYWGDEYKKKLCISCWLKRRNKW